MDKIKFIDFMIDTLTRSVEIHSQIMYIESFDNPDKAQIVIHNSLVEDLKNYYKEWINVFLIKSLTDYKTQEILDKYSAANNALSYYKMLQDIENLRKI